MRFAATVALPLAVVTRAGWIDPDTRTAHLTTASLEPDDDTVYELIMSDEFNTAGRRFKNGHDPKWTALNKNDYTNDALQFYGDDTPWPNMILHSLNGADADSAGGFNPMAAFGSIFKQGSGELLRGNQLSLKSRKQRIPRERRSFSFL